MATNFLLFQLLHILTICFPYLFYPFLKDNLVQALYMANGIHIYETNLISLTDNNCIIMNADLQNK